MTTQQMIELVLQQSPLDDGNIAELYLTKALHEFCEQTQMVKKRVDLELTSKQKFHKLTDIKDIVAIREIGQDFVSKDTIIFDNTELPSYLQQYNGFWYVDQVEGDVTTIAVGYWNGAGESYFDVGTVLTMLYSATVPLVRKDAQDQDDYSLSPEIPERFHDLVVTRASEKANLTNPNLRSYFYSVWKDEIKKAKQYAMSKNTDASYNVKVYTL